MKRLVHGLVVLTLVLGCLGFVGQSPAIAVNISGSTMQSISVLAAETQYRNPADYKLSTEYGQKIDLNNAHVRTFRKMRGFYPTLARKIIDNAPYDNVEDVLEIPGLSDRQKERLQANLDSFTVTPPADVFNEGGDRINPGVY